MLVALYKHKKDLKASVGKALRYRETSFFGLEFKITGTFAVVGSSEYKRDWFAEVTMKENIIMEVK